MASFSLPSCARALSLLAATLLLSLLLSAPSMVLAGDDLPGPVWAGVCQSPFQFCSKVETYRYWGEKPSQRLTFSVDALMKDVNNRDYLTVWLLMDEVDVEFAKELARADLYVVVVHPRGTKLSGTHYGCNDTAKTRTDQCWLNAKCAEELATRSAKKDDLFNASHFSVDQVAHDLEWALRTLGDGRKNVILAQGLSTVHATRLLQLHPQIPVGVILLDYVHPLLFDTYGYLGGVGQDVALQHLLAICDDNVECVGRLGAIDGAWGRLQKLMSLANSKQLTCAKKLKWGTNKQLGSSFAEQLRSVLALMLRYPTYPFVASKTDLAGLIPSMLYRLQRCQKKDIDALNALYSYVNSTEKFTCPDNVAIQMHWLVNEFLQAAPPKNVGKYWSGEASRRAVLPPAVHINDFHTAALKFPAVRRTNDSLVLPVAATQSILFLGADVDPMAPRGAASQATISFQKFRESMKAIQIRGVANAPAGLLSPCIINNLKFYAGRSSWAGPEVCTVEEAKKIDFLNGNTKEYYGASDGWDFDLPNSDDGSSRGDGGGDGNHGSVLRTVFRVVLFLIIFAAVGAGGFYAYTYMKARGFRYNRVSDNFYDNIRV